MDALEWFFAVNGVHGSSQATLLELVTQWPLPEMKGLCRMNKFKWRGVRRYLIFLK